MDKKVAFGLGFQGFEYLGTKNKEKQWVHSEGEQAHFQTNLGLIVDLGMVQISKYWPFQPFVHCTCTITERERWGMGQGNSQKMNP